MIYHLENWSVIQEPYDAPELGIKYLRGTRVEDDWFCRTSSIVKVEGRRVTTRSGSIYILGTPDPDYAAYCVSIGKEIDPECPIKIIK